MSVPQERLIIITGMSGAGKSTALRCFEDLGYCCIDNLPPSLSETFVQLYRQSPGSASNIAIVCDVRSGELFSSVRDALIKLAQKDLALDVLFFDCDNDELVTRFKETRRVPPLGIGLRTEEALLLERQRLEPVRELATRVINTTELSVKQLQERILSMYADAEGVSPLSVTVLSFGFKFGIPADADFVFDTRFLPNPFYHEELRALTGRDEQVRSYVMRHTEAQDFADSLLKLLLVVLPHYTDVHKFNAVVALGCTGGRHRSVCLAEHLVHELVNHEVKAIVQHRDIDRV